jgi:hypothetical protein
VGIDWKPWFSFKELVDVLTNVDDPEEQGPAKRTVSALGREISIDHKLNAQFRSPGHGETLRWTISKRAASAGASSSSAGNGASGSSSSASSAKVAAAPAASAGGHSLFLAVAATRSCVSHFPTAPNIQVPARGLVPVQDPVVPLSHLLVSHLLRLPLAFAWYVRPSARCGRILACTETTEHEPPWINPRFAENESPWYDHDCSFQYRI